MTPHGTRKVILATNIGETSLTVPGVRFVIDTGVQKRRIFNPSLGIESLQVYKISKSSAAQRAGRAGREAKGTCYRLYPQVEFDGLKDNTTPEIRDCDIVSLVLTLKVQGHDDILNFPFLDRPKRDSVVRSLEVLYLLGALGKDGKPTKLGKQMDLLPLTPQLAKTLFSAARGEENCVAEVIDIIACLSVSNANAIFMTSEPGRREEGTELRSHFASPLGDLITLLRAFREFLSVANHGVGVKEWCRKWDINWRAAKHAMVRSRPRFWIWGC
jgi:ATP-dependent RNA helicase DHR2